MKLDELLGVRLEKKKILTRNEYDELGLYGDGLCEFDDDYYEDEDEDEDIF